MDIALFGILQNSKRSDEPRMAHQARPKISYYAEDGPLNHTMQTAEIVEGQ